MTINFNGKTYHSFEEMLAAEKGCSDITGSVNTTSGDVNYGRVGGIVNTYNGNIRHR